MKKKRETTAEEKALFENVMSGKERISRPRKIIDTQHTKKKFVIARAPSGINGQTEERLSRGDLRPEATLDLHGHTEGAAYDTLVRFIENADRAGKRLVLIITGKGTHQVDPYAPFDMELELRSRGVLRSMVPRWLSEPPLVSRIADVRHAHGRHGGGGAFYVYLRKHRNTAPRIVQI